MKMRYAKQLCWDGFRQGMEIYSTCGTKDCADNGCMFRPEAMRRKPGDCKYPLCAGNLPESRCFLCPDGDAA